jgi:hypothetical protein
MGGIWPPFRFKEASVPMFDISTINKRHFQIKLGAITLEVEPPKLKTLKKIMRLSKSKEEAMDDLAEAIILVLNKNSSGYVVPNDLVEELDYDQMNEILTAYFEWLTKAKNSPN